MVLTLHHLLVYGNVTELAKNWTLYITRLSHRSKPDYLTVIHVINNDIPSCLYGQIASCIETQPSWIRISQTCYKLQPLQTCSKSVNKLQQCCCFILLLHMWKVVYTELEVQIGSQQVDSFSYTSCKSWCVSNLMEQLACNEADIGMKSAFYNSLQQYTLSSYSTMNRAIKNKIVFKKLWATLYGIIRVMNTSPV